MRQAHQLWKFLWTLESPARYARTSPSVPLSPCPWLAPSSLPPPTPTPPRHLPLLFPSHPHPLQACAPILPRLRAPRPAYVSVPLSLAPPLFRLRLRLRLRHATSPPLPSSSPPLQPCAPDPSPLARPRPTSSRRGLDRRRVSKLC